jgi:hypothetical protein
VIDVVGVPALCEKQKGVPGSFSLAFIPGLSCKLPLWQTTNLSPPGGGEPARSATGVLSLRWSMAASRVPAMS